MKQMIPAALLGLALAACDTVPQGEPYPYPPQGDPYPYPGNPAPYPPPPQGYPPEGPLVPGDSCPIVSSGDWRSWVATGSDGRPMLMLSGSVVAPTAGYRMEFRPNLTERRSYPVQMVAVLQPFPPTGPAAQVQTTHDLSWQWPLGSGPVGSMTVLCGSRTLAQVPVTGGSQ